VPRAKIAAASANTSAAFAADSGEQRDQDHGASLNDPMSPLRYHQQRAVEFERNDDGEDHPKQRLENG
jgi:hypothetical protein